MNDAVTSAEMSVFSIAADAKLDPSPINPRWILLGSPSARKKILSVSADEAATILVWDCSSGRFNWFYNIDETAYIIEGSAQLKDSSGKTYSVRAGDLLYFPSGSRVEWFVDSYIRKVAFLRDPHSAKWIFLRSVYRRIMSIMRVKHSSPSKSMFDS
jgi:uncharacterized cupin superfamily protein